MAMKARFHGLVALAVVGALALTGCSSGGSSGGSSANTAASKTLSIAVTAAVTSFKHSQTGGGSDEIYWRAVYTTLLNRDSKGNIVPDAAESWSYSSDKKTLTLKLRDGMTFTDGSAVDAAAVVANLVDLKNGGGPNAGYLKHMASATATDALTVTLALSAPDPALLYYLSMGAGVISNPKDFNAADAATNPQGSGPYTFDESRSTVGSVYTFVRNKGYWDPQSWPYDTVVMKVIPDATSALNALKSGQVNAAQLNGQTVSAAKSGGLDVHYRYSSVMSLQIRDTKGTKVPALANEKVRQAMNLAFDRPAIVKNLLEGHGEPTDQFFINVGNEAYIPSAKSQYGYDVAKAKQLMAEAGYASGFSLTLPTDSDFTFLGPTVQQSLGAIGIKVNFQTVPNTEYVNKTIAGNYPVFLNPPTSRSAWFDLNLWVAPGATWNSFGSEDPALTALIDKVQTQSDADAAATYQQIGQRVLDLAWFVPLYRPQLVTATDKSTKVEFTPGINVPLLQGYAPVG